MEGIYGKARPEEVAPEVRSAPVKACSGLEVELFVRDLVRDVCVEASEALGYEKGAEARVWFHRCRSVREFLVPVVVLPTGGDFWPLMASRVRSLKLSGRQKKEVLVRDTEFRAALKRYRSSDPIRAVQAGKREVAAGSSPKKRVVRF